MSSLSYRKRPVSRGPLASRALNPVAAMRSFLMLLWIEIKRSQGFWLLPLLVGLGIFAAFYRDQDGVVLWQDLNFSTLRSYAVIAPLTAAFAAWLRDRDRRRRMRDLAHSLPIAPLRRDLLTLGIASLWGMIGYAIVAVWFAWKGVSEATWGGPDLGLILAGALAIVVFAGIGGLVGSLVPSKFSPILALGVTFLLTMMFSYSSEHPLKLLMPWSLTTASGSDIYYDLLYVRESLVWLAGLLAAVIAITALARKRGAVAWTGLAASVLLAGIGAVPLIRQDSAPSGANVRVAAFDWSCATESGIEVCVHPAYEAKLDDVSDVLSGLTSPLVGLEGVPVTWHQNGPWSTDDASTGMLYGVESRSQAWGDGMLYGPDWRSQAWGVVDTIFPNSDSVGGPFTSRPASQLVIVYWLAGKAGHGDTGQWAFGYPEEVPHSQGDPPEYDAAELAEFKPRMDAALERFAALPAAEKRAWLEANWDALRAGELMLEDLP